MFLSRLLFLSLFVSLARSNDLTSTTQGGSEPPPITVEPTVQNLMVEPQTTEETAHSHSVEPTAQTAGVPHLPEQTEGTDQNSTGETTPPAANDVTSVKTELPTLESSIRTTAHPDLTPPRKIDSSDIGRAAKGDAVTQEKYGQRFDYDYQTLRIQGLICALILFIMGISILTCGRCRNASCCRKKKKRRAVDEMTRL